MTRYATELTAGVLLCAAFLAGCGGNSTSTGEVTPSAPKCPQTVSATEANSGQTLCVAQGGQVTLSLKTAAGKPWAPPEPGTPGILTSGGAFSATAGTQVGTWKATKAGQTMLTSTRPNCPSAAPGTVSCHSVKSFTLTVKVS
jgi:hypothetical protein